MDKHTKRYMSERFGFYGEQMDFSDLMSCVRDAEREDDFIYLSHAIKDLSSEERNYMRMKLWDKQYGI